MLSQNEYKLQPYDYLYISVRSTNEEINNLYQTISSSFSGGLTNNESNFFLTGYMINDSGNVFIPTLGEVYVKDKTIEEARKTIEDKFGEILIDAIVNVRLTSFNVTFLGEVSQQGRISFYKEHVNILEGIGMVGGISGYGDMRNVKVLRQQDSVIKIFELNLENRKLLEHKDFFLHPNDIVYVPPRRTKDFLNFVRDYSTLITLITSTITTTLLIIELTKSK